MTMVLSITHRGTGLFQSALMTGFAIFPFVTSQSYPAVLAQVAEMGLASAPLLFAAKFAIVWPVMFHLFNGLRHLVSIASKFSIWLGRIHPLAPTATNVPLDVIYHAITLFFSELGHGLGVPNC
jgi:succinate dehydrogenase/fumarate reductase cytochrome b subunit